MRRVRRPAAGSAARCLSPGSRGQSRSQPSSRPRPQSKGGARPGGGRAKGEPPRMLICYICGRQFGSNSLAIHEPQRMKKWEAENARLPTPERRPRPVKPDVAAAGGVDHAGHASVDAQNEAAYRAYESNLSPCPHCGRTFNADRLAVHLRSCRPGSAHACGPSAVLSVCAPPVAK